MILELIAQKNLPFDAFSLKMTANFVKLVFKNPLDVHRANLLGDFALDVLGTRWLILWSPDLLDPLRVKWSTAIVWPSRPNTCNLVTVSFFFQEIRFREDFCSNCTRYYDNMKYQQKISSRCDIHSSNVWYERYPIARQCISNDTIFVSHKIKKCLASISLGRKM